MSRWRVLVSAPYAMPVIERYRRELEAAGCEVVVAPAQERLSEAELLLLVTDVDGIICGDDQITERVLAAAPRLKVISKWGTGVDSIDRAAAAGHGVPVLNTPNAFSEPVADTVLGYALLFARRLREMDEQMHQRVWEKLQLVSLGELTLGVIGVGNCGKAVLRRAAAFGMRLLGTDPVTPSAEFLRATGVSMASRDALLREADIISLNPDLNPTSFHLLDATALSLVKRSAYVINTSRGPIVDEAALAQALADRRLAGAALDVFEVEPLPASSPLRTLENCWLAPHNANSSPGAAEHVHERTLRNLIEALRSARPTSGRET